MNVVQRTLSKISLKNKKILIFDLDDTLAPSKFKIDVNMRDALEDLSTKYYIVVITGGGD
ncbi:MAG: hypothetical protein LBF00_02885 [Mycoplasmataceae bacterium]|jgi:hydroxymethylpyrimidine pyrophosphatase-like HAD family hydrolase|nr:hypothetical protein [Mycoplasmataceae bacterium]